MPEPTYAELSAEFDKLLDEREEWRRIIREQGAEVERVTRERDDARQAFDLLKSEVGYTAMQRDWLLAEAPESVRKRYFRLVAEDKAKSALSPVDVPAQPEAATDG